MHPPREVSPRSILARDRRRGRAPRIRVALAVFCAWCSACPISALRPISALERAPRPSLERRPVPKEHPRLLGSLERLKKLAAERSDAWRRVLDVARGSESDAHSKVVSLSLAAAIENDQRLARQAVERVLEFVNGPVKKGHVPFAHDLALCALAYDLCFSAWSDAERSRFHEYLNATVDANIESETHVFHNGWYGYKNWGIGLACYATYHESPRSPAILKALEEDYRTRAAPALELAGAGGGFAEGYYVHYWLYEWLFFCEVARIVEGVDYCEMAPSFFRNRALASAFEMYPGIREYGSRRPVPMGDGGGRRFGGDRDKALSARRILVERYRDDPIHLAVNSLSETTPRSSVGAYAYKDFLWRDAALPKADLKRLPLSHMSPGPGYMYARSSWDEDATYFFFKCGDRFTAHQHLDVGHFLIYKHEELAGDGGHYDDFGSSHDVNYHLRTIAHSTILVNDPSETWPGIRAGEVTGNDGGQAHAWPHHNGAVVDAAEWKARKELYDIAEVAAFEDRGEYLYVAGDCSRAYSRKKLEIFTRQIVFIRPGTFVIFDRVRSTRPDFKKTWLLQAMKTPERKGEHLVVTNGRGRLFVQTCLPRDARVRLASGDDLYSYGGKSYPPRRDTGPAPECRVEVSPPEARAEDFFLHVLSATDSGAEPAPAARCEVAGTEVTVAVGDATIAFTTEALGGAFDRQGRRERFPRQVRLRTGE